MANKDKTSAPPSLKLGKAPAKKDDRNLKFSAVLKSTPLPPAYDFDATHPEVKTPMFGNDQLGDCVIAGRAHQTLRFELVEQGKPIQIADTDVTQEYFRETGGADTGLVVLDSLKSWRARGWTVGKNNYKIQAFAEINYKNPDEVRQAIFADIGVGLGVQLPISAQAQFQQREPWVVTPGPDGEPGSWGGHYVYVPGYDQNGPICVTWGTKQPMSWEWFEKYCDEAFAIFDAKDSFKLSMIRTDVLHEFIQKLT